MKKTLSIFIVALLISYSADAQIKRNYYWLSSEYFGEKDL